MPSPVCAQGCAWATQKVDAFSALMAPFVADRWSVGSVLPISRL